MLREMGSLRASSTTSPRQSRTRALLAACKLVLILSACDATDAVSETGGSTTTSLDAERAEFKKALDQKDAEISELRGQVAALSQNADSRWSALLALEQAGEPAAAASAADEFERLHPNDTRMRQLPAIRMSIQKRGEALRNARDAEVVSVKQLENFGIDYVGKTVRVDAAFAGLSQLWVTNLPGVRGQYTSTEGLVQSFSKSAAKNWVGFFIKADDELYQRVFAQKSQFIDALTAAKSGDRLTIVGKVVDFRTNNWAALIVSDIQFTPKKSEN